MPGEMEQKVVVHQHLVSPPGQTGHDHLSIHTYPFRTLPFLSSHLRPEFAILEAGRQLDHLSESERARLIEQVPLLEQISNIYSAWTTQLPPHAMGDKSFIAQPIALDPSQPNVVEDDTLSTTSGCTFPGRFDQGYCACVLTEHRQDGCCSCVERHQMCPQHRDCEVAHPHVTVRDKNTADANAPMWTGEHVRSWSEDCFAHSHEWENEPPGLEADWNIEENNSL